MILLYYLIRSSISPTNEYDDDFDALTEAKPLGNGRAESELIPSCRQGVHRVPQHAPI